MYLKIYFKKKKNFESQCQMKNCVNMNFWFNFHIFIIHFQYIKLNCETFYIFYSVIIHLFIIIATQFAVLKLYIVIFHFFFCENKVSSHF